MKRFLSFLFIVAILFAIGAGAWLYFQRETQPTSDTSVVMEKVSDNSDEPMENVRGDVDNSPLPSGSYEYLSLHEYELDVHAFVRGYVVLEKILQDDYGDCYNEETGADPGFPACPKYTTVMLRVVESGDIPHFDRTLQSFGNKPLGSSFEPGSNVKLGCLDGDAITFSTVKIPEVFDGSGPFWSQSDRYYGRGSQFVTPEVTSALLASSIQNTITLEIYGDVYAPPFGISPCHTPYHTTQLYPQL
jgi:hypothetical protein